MLSWAFVALMVYLPFEWIGQATLLGAPKGAALRELVISTLICWGIAGAFGFFLVLYGRRIKLRRAKEEQEMQQLLAAPLAEIKPSHALIKAGEKAYGAVMARLQETKTVGYSAGTTGVSVRVAKGVTLRTSGTRGKAIKGMVSVASGELVVTDKRVVFAGDKKSFAIPLGDLLNTTNYKDGFGFSNDKATYTLTTDNDRQRMLFAVALNKVLRA
jgi:hypothetical protein